MVFGELVFVVVECSLVIVEKKFTDAQYVVPRNGCVVVNGHNIDVVWC